MELMVVWVDEKESFTCALDECSFKMGRPSLFRETDFRCNAYFESDVL